MLKRAKRRLSRIFVVAGLSLCSIFSGCAGPSSVFRNNPVANDNKDLWEQVIGSDTVQYDDVPDTGRDGKHTIAVQLEEALDLHGLLLQPYYSPTDILGRHGASATMITNETADKLSGRDIDVRYIEREASIEDWIFDTESLYARAIFFNADVITLSMGMPAAGDQSYAYSFGTLDTHDEVKLADRFWEKSHAIFVWAAGNGGTDPEIGLERSEANHLLRADALIKVGAAFEDVDGTIYLEPYSSRSGASFVTSNPYMDGFSYPYIRTEADIRQRAENFYNSVPYGETKTGRDIFIEYVKNLPDRDPYTAFFGRPDILESCHANFKAADFEGKEALEADRDWQRTHPEEVLEAFINGLVDAAKYARWYSGAFEDGHSTALAGTSFAAPYAAGMVAAMHEKYPQLSEYDLIAAALIAAQPVDYVRNPDGSIGEVEFKDNGRGLLHNSYAAGFGYLNPDDYEAVLKKMVAMQRFHKKLKTTESRVDTKMVQFKVGEKDSSNVDKIERSVEPRIDETPPLGPVWRDYDHGALEDGGVVVGIGSSTDSTVTSYEIEVSEDIVALRVNLAMEFVGGSDNIPEKITLINPAGGEIEVSPSRVEDGVLSLATTDGHFGNHTKGTWTIVVPGGAQLKSARITASGFQNDGLVDTYLDQEGVDAPASVVKKKNKESDLPKNPPPAKLPIQGPRP